VYAHFCVVSRKFWSAENFGPGPIFSLKILVPGTNFFGKIGPALKILVLVFFSMLFVNLCLE